MTDFAVSERASDKRAALYAFAQTALSPDAAARDADGGKDRDGFRAVWKACAGAGVLGLALPEDLGGSGFSAAETVEALQGLGEGSTDNGLGLGLSAHIWPMQMPVLEFAAPDQKARYMSGMVSGDIICAHAVTEDASGSDAMALATTATETGDGFVLNGSKVWIGLAPVCDVAFVFATTNPDHGAWGVTAFLVDANSDGIERGPQEQKLGTRSLPFGSLTFRDCHVPRSAMLGPKGAGQSIFARSLDWERRFIFATQVGAMKRQLETCIAYGRDREVFGKAIDAHQSVSNRLAEMRMRYETSRLMLQKAAWQVDNGVTDHAFAAMTKLHISEAALASSLDAVRMFGARGYLDDLEHARGLRDAVGGVIYGGTSDIQRQIIATHQRRG